MQIHLSQCVQVETEGVMTLDMCDWAENNFKDKKKQKKKLVAHIIQLSVFDGQTVRSHNGQTAFYTLKYDDGSPCPEATELGFSVATPRVTGGGGNVPHLILV